MNLLICTGVYNSMGIGNLFRMYSLYIFLLNSKKFKSINFYTNNNLFSEDILDDPNIIFVNKLQQIYDVVLLDIPINNNELINKLSQKSKKIIAFDYFNYANTNIDTIINLVNHNKNDINKFSGNIYEGVEYSILKDEVLMQNQQKAFDKNENIDVLISFGGEDPNSNTIKILNYLKLFNNLNISVILGALNKDNSYIKKNYRAINIIEETDKIGYFISKNDIVFCGGGTTLLESIYIGNPIVAIGQNNFEHDFISSIKMNIDIFDLDQIKTLLLKVKDNKFRENISIEYKKFIDGNGKKRIKNLILGLR